MNWRMKTRAAPPQLRPDYEGRDNLGSLIPVAPGDLEGAEPQTTRRLVARLARALRQERIRGCAGRGNYDPVRHLRLSVALQAESRALPRRGLLSGDDNGDNPAT